MRTYSEDWQNEAIKDTWRIFRIMSEFVEGYERMNAIGPCVSIFGSARTKPDAPEYQQAEQIAKAFVKEGFGIITGGGPGIMEAGNKGAKDGKGVSVGLTINLPHEQGGNAYIDPDKIINFDFFFARKVMLLKYSQAVVVMPGGFGTLDELFEALILVQTQKGDKIPIILFGKAFWGGLVDWIRDTVVTHKYINAPDLDYLFLTDSIEETIERVNHFYENTALKPNF